MAFTGAPMVALNINALPIDFARHATGAKIILPGGRWWARRVIHLLIALNCRAVGGIRLSA